MPNAPRKTHRPPWNKKGRRPPRKSDKRYYTYRWTKFSRLFRQRNPLCVVCGNAAEVTDHVLPAALIAEADFYKEDNLQSLCHKCHNRKRATEDKERHKTKAPRNRR